MKAAEAKAAEAEKLVDSLIAQYHSAWVPHWVADGYERVRGAAHPHPAAGPLAARNQGAGGVPFPRTCTVRADALSVHCIRQHVLTPFHGQGIAVRTFNGSQIA